MRYGDKAAARTAVWDLLSAKKAAAVDKHREARLAFGAVASRNGWVLRLRTQLMAEPRRLEVRASDRRYQRPYCQLRRGVFCRRRRRLYLIDRFACAREQCRKHAHRIVRIHFDLPRILNGGQCRRQAIVGGGARCGAAAHPFGKLRIAIENSERLGWRWWWSAEMRYAVLFDRFTLRPMFRFHLYLRDGLSGYK